MKPLPRTYANRVVAVGDAAGLVKPTTGGGIYYSLLSGETAASAVHDALVDDDLSDKRLSKYEAEWKRLFGSDCALGTTRG